MVKFNMDLEFVRINHMQFQYEVCAEKFAMLYISICKARRKLLFIMFLRITLIYRIHWSIILVSHNCAPINQNRSKKNKCILVRS